MIRVEVVNDGTGDVERGNYDVSVTVPRRGEAVVYSARVKDFDRGRGWAELVREAVAALEEVGV